MSSASASLSSVLLKWTGLLFISTSRMHVALPGASKSKRRKTDKVDLYDFCSLLVDDNLTPPPPTSEKSRCS